MWSLNVSKFSQIPRTLVCILVHLNNADVSVGPFISRFSNPFTNRLQISPILLLLLLILLLLIILTLLLLLLLLLSFLVSFSYQLLVIIFHWSLSDSKSLEFSRTLLSILVDRNNAVVWMASLCLPISKLL